MAKKSSHGSVLFTYIAKGRLLYVMEDGVTLYKPLGGSAIKVYRHKKPEVPLAEWTNTKMAFRAKLEAEQPWRLNPKRLPSLKEIMRQVNDGICDTPTGHRVEPDGTGPDGVPSWALLYMLI